LDADSFVSRINENPEDGTLRLVYADWLDEGGHHEEAKAWRDTAGLVPLLVGKGGVLFWCGVRTREDEWHWFPHDFYTSHPELFDKKSKRFHREVGNATLPAVFDGDELNRSVLLGEFETALSALSALVEEYIKYERGPDVEGVRGGLPDARPVAPRH
jgi:uncharacterized protein (TIGR02996 family)